MNSVDRKHALEKLVKLLALAQSSNPHEAALALQMAKDIMQKYNLTEGDVNEADLQEAKFQSTTKNPEVAHSILAGLVANAFHCVLYKTRNTDNFRIEFNFVGLSHKAENAAYVYEVLLRQLKADALSFAKEIPKQTKPKNRANRIYTFSLGWVNAIHQLVKSFAAIPENELAVLKAWEKKQSFNKKDITINRNKTRNNDNAASQGFRSGNNAKLFHGVNAKSKAKFLSGGEQ